MPLSSVPATAVDPPPVCPCNSLLLVNNLNVPYLTSTTIRLAWTPTPVLASLSSYNVYFRPVATGTFTIVSTPEAAATLTGLTASTAYEVYAEGVLHDGSLVTSLNPDARLVVTTAASGVTWNMPGVPVPISYLPLKVAPVAGAIPDVIGTLSASLLGSRPPIYSLDPSNLPLTSLRGFIQDTRGNNSWGSQENANVGHTFTLSGWTIMSGGFVNNYPWDLGLQNNSTINFFRCENNSASTYAVLIEGENSGLLSITSSIPFSSSQWTHIACTVDGSTGIIVLYQNGVSVGTITFSGAQLTAWTAGTMTLSVIGGNSGVRGIMGFSSNFMYWTSLLTPTQISNLFQYQSTFPAA